jgi:hypothetical protein
LSQLNTSAIDSGDGVFIGGNKPDHTTTHSSLVQIMTFKSALTVASIALIATASSLAMAAPSEARDGCGRRFKFSNRHGQCVLKNKFRGNHQASVVVRPTIRPVIVRPMIQPVIRPIFRPVVVRPAIRPVIRPVIVRPVIRPVVRPLIQPVVLHPYAQPSTLHPYPQTAPNPYTQVIYNHNNPTIQTVNPYPQTIAQPFINNPYTPFAY